jgi:hypothetical protein
MGEDLVIHPKMMEMAGKRSVYIPEILYCYDFTGIRLATGSTRPGALPNEVRDEDYGEQGGAREADHCDPGMGLFRHGPSSFELAR